MKKYKRFFLSIVGVLLLFALVLTEQLSGKEREKHLLINEVCSNNFSTGLKEGYEDSDWVELYNPTDKAIFLGEYYLSDEKADIEKCKLPDVYIEADGYLVLYAEGLEEGDLNFRISSEGEVLYLATGGNVVDQAEIPGLKTNTTLSRMDNGNQWANTKPTIGVSNEGAIFISDSDVEKPVFSAEGGFYSESFQLEIEGRGNIYYTLDGSDPDESSLYYTAPVEIKNVSDRPNVYSARTDMSTISQFVPEEPVDKILVVRAVCIDEKGNSSDIVTNSYFVGYQDEAAYQEMYTVSLVTDPDNLFDYEKGIYVLGETYDQYMLEDGSMEDTVQIPANYRKKGKVTERAGNIEIWDRDGNKIMNRQAGLRIHGSTTRGSLQKSFSIYAREMYDGKATFDEGIFGQGEEVRKFFVYSDRDQSKLKHILNQELISDREVEKQDFIRCNVFLDGEYWGVYSLAEVYDEYYFQNHYGIPLGNVEIFEGANPEPVLEFLNSGVDMSSEEAYEKISELMDIQSFIDYYGSMVYIDNYDWLPGNAICWRSTSEGENEKEDGKWRWAVWDTEGGEIAYDRNTFQNGNILCWEQDLIVMRLMQNENIRRDFVVSFMDMVNQNFEEGRVLEKIDEMMLEYEKSYELNRKRYLGECDTHKYTDPIREFFTRRKDVMISVLKEEFDLQADPVWIALLINKDNAAEFCINTISLEKDCSFWQGLYFNSYPVKLTVRNIDEGEEFLGWYEDDGTLISTEHSISVELGNDTKIIHANFAE